MHTKGWSRWSCLPAPLCLWRCPQAVGKLPPFVTARCALYTGRGVGVGSPTQPRLSACSRSTKLVPRAPGAFYVLEQCSEADFKGIWGQTWCGAGLWGGHGSFGALPAPAGLQRCSGASWHSWALSSPALQGQGSPQVTGERSFLPQWQAARSSCKTPNRFLEKKKKKGGKREKFPLPAAGWVQPPLLLQGQVRVCPAACEHPCPPCLSRSSAQSWILLYFHFFDPSQRSVRGNLHFLHSPWHGATGTRGFRAPPSRSCYRWKSQVCST